MQLRASDQKSENTDQLIRQRTDSPRRITCGSSPCRSLKHRFELLIDYFAGKTIDGNVEPVAFFSFDDKICQTSGVRWVPAGLRNYVNHEVPRPCLRQLGQSARNSLFCFGTASERCTSCAN